MCCSLLHTHTHKADVYDEIQVLRGTALSALEHQPLPAQRMLLRLVLSPLLRYSPRNAAALASLAPVFAAAYGHWLASLDALWARALHRQG
jgi:hypothetical protein